MLFILFLRTLSNFLTSAFILVVWKLVDKFTKIFPSAFRPFIVHHQWELMTADIPEGRVFVNDPGRPGFDPKLCHTKDSKNDT